MNERRFEEDVVPGKPLGRHVKHDDRSRNFAVAPVASLGDLKSIRHRRLVKPYDQGNIGSCVPNSAAGTLSTLPFHHRYGETTARKWYHELTGWTPTNGIDPGSTGLDIARLLKTKGLISGYRTAFGLTAALTALQASAVLVGMSWRTGCDNPDSSGLIKWIGSVRGGHELEFNEIDVERKLVGFEQSWGPSWGAGGRGYMSWDDFGNALLDQGDVTVLEKP